MHPDCLSLLINAQIYLRCSGLNAAPELTDNLLAHFSSPEMGAEDRVIALLLDGGHPALDLLRDDGKKNKLNQDQMWYKRPVAYADS